MKGFIGNIEQRTGANSDFRRVLYTGSQLQLVLMALKPGEEIGHEEGIVMHTRAGAGASVEHFTGQTTE